MKSEDNGLYGMLRSYDQKGIAAFHMPGHKRRFHLIEDPYSIDITEISGFDNLHHAEGILQEAQSRASRLFGSSETFYLVNGSTSGVLAAVSAACPRGGKILAARNCHKSVYHAIALRSLQAAWIYPETDKRRGICGSISPDEVEQMLERDPDIAAVILTSPTYDGVCSDIAGIAEIVHKYRAVLIVDEAHGAHFGLVSGLPESAVRLGADVVIQSMHKTLPSLTQTALLHLCGSRIDRGKIRYYLGVYQTSSPSYVLMASMDECVRIFTEESGREKMRIYFHNLMEARRELENLKNLYLVTGEEPEWNCFLYDRSRIVISTERTSLTGVDLFALLRNEFDLEAEMAAEHFVVFLTSVGNEKEDFDRLIRALKEIDGRSLYSQKEAPHSGLLRMAANPSVMNMGDALECGSSFLPLEESAGRISGDTIYLYPPGIPLLIPGEQITPRLLEDLARYRREGFSLQGMSDLRGEQIRVVNQ